MIVVSADDNNTRCKYETRNNVESNVESNMCSHATWMGKELKRMITVFLPEKEAPSKELSMSMQLGWVKN